MQPSSPASFGDVELRCALGPVRMTLRDHSFQIAASGVGEIRTRLPAGLYTLRLEGGGNEREMSIVLRPAQTCRMLDIPFEMATVAPIPGSTNVRESQTTALARLCEAEPTARIGQGARLVVFARNVDGGTRPPSLEGVSVIIPEDEAAETPLEKEVQRSKDEGWAGWSVEVPPGGGRLRTRGARGRGSETPSLLDQSLWFVEGWTLIVILPAWGEASRLAPARALLQMNRKGYAAHRSDQERRDVEVGLELALASLERGATALSDDLLQRLLHAKFTDPLLGIAGAHSLLREPSPPKELVEKVLNHLFQLTKGAPDVEALCGLARRHGFSAPQPSTPVRWPPLFEASYRALVEDDDLATPSFVPGSLAERISGSRVSRGPWTTWNATASGTSEAAETPLGELRPVRELIRKLSESRSLQARMSALLGSLERVSAGSMAKDVPVSGPLQRDAVVRLSRALNDRLGGPRSPLEVEDQMNQINLRSLALRLRVPVRAAWSAVKWISDVSGPPSTPSPGIPKPPVDLMFFSPSVTVPPRPAAPPVDPDDPQKGQWGGKAVRPARELSAKVVPAEPGWFEVSLELASTDPKSPLSGTVNFHLHPTFVDPDPEVPVRNGKATLALKAWGAFTVGAEADGGKTRLELDLSRLDSAPKEFRDR